MEMKKGADFSRLIPFYSKSFSIQKTFHREEFSEETGEESGMLVESAPLQWIWNS
ncbi:hypothetical protein [Algoriphagus vanfongensis]|uniref:hypothetical protein n=1 Tax=Algoriphagus vanfongensis TaxID=426371 RepID=UPI000406DFF2|nr:hypothetical protein [Algoriphagus vanfongensis]